MTNNENIIPYTEIAESPFDLESYWGRLSHFKCLAN